MHVELRPPPVGNTQLPIKLNGPGTIERREDGLHVTGAKVVSYGQGLLLLLGIVAIGIPLGLLHAFTDPSQRAGRGGSSSTTSRAVPRWG